MKIEDIINLLCSHEISKHTAITKLKDLTDGLRKNNAIEFEVADVACSVENNHGSLYLKLPYQGSKISGKLKKGDKVDVIILP